MKDIFEQLNQLPKGKLRLKPEMRLRFLLYRKMIVKDFSKFKILFVSHSVMRAAIVMVLILPIVVAVPGYAYASKGVVEGHLLYPVKKAVENIELSLATTEEKKSETLDKLAQRRFAEAEVISEDLINNDKKEDVLVKTIQAGVALNIQSNILKKVTEEENDKKVKAEDPKAKLLENVALNVGIKRQEKVVDTVAWALENIKNNKYKNKIKKNSFEDMASTTKEEVRLETEEMTTSTQEVMFENNKNTNNGNNKVLEKNNPSTTNSRFEILKQEVKDLKNYLQSEGFVEEEVDELSEKLNNKIKNSENAQSKNNQKEVEDILESAETLKNNAKFFMKKTDKNNGQGNGNSNNNSETSKEKSNNGKAKGKNK